MSFIYAAMLVPLLASAGIAGADTPQFFESHPNEIDLREEAERIIFANTKIGLAFVKSERGFEIDRLYGIEQDQDFLTSATVIGSRELFEIRMTPDIRGSGRDRRDESIKPGLMGIMDEMAANAFSVGAHSATSVSWKKSESDGNTTLHLYWNKIPVRDKQAMDVEVMVTLRPGDPMSYWRINILNLGTHFGLERVRFPLLNLATQDPTPNLMHVRVDKGPEHITWKVAHFPPNITFAEESYWLPYDCAIGPFDGDWYDAAQIYRKWALAQSWCNKGPLLTRTDVPKWYKEAPFIFYTAIGDSAKGTHSMAKNAHIAADHFREYLRWAGMPMPANWYSWKQYVPGMTSYNVPFGSHRFYHQGRWRGMTPVNVHDGNYPKIGSIKEYTEETHKLRTEGGMVCPYVALEIFDQGPDENSPYAKQARPHVVRDLYGVKRMWSNETAWQM